MANTRLKEGDRFRLVSRRPWRAGAARGVEVRAERCEVSRVKAGGFDYRVLGLLALDGIPPFGAPASFGTGGMVWGYADELQAAGDLTPLEHTEDVERRPWVREHGACYGLPAILDAEVAAGRLIDLSWKNDACPSFMRACDESHPDPATYRPILWADHVDPTKREVETAGRYGVMVLEPDQVELYAGDSVEEALRALYAWEPPDATPPALTPTETATEDGADLTEIINHLTVDGGISARLEFPGCIVIPHPWADDLEWWFGTANEQWDGDLVKREDCGSQPVTTIRTRAKSSEQDPSAVALAIALALLKHYDPDAEVR